MSSLTLRVSNLPEMPKIDHEEKLEYCFQFSFLVCFWPCNIKELNKMVEAQLTMLVGGNWLQIEDFIRGCQHKSMSFLRCVTPLCPIVFCTIGAVLSISRRGINCFLRVTRANCSFCDALRAAGSQTRRAKN